MNYATIKKLPSLTEITQRCPLSAWGQEQIKRDRLEIKNIIEGKDHRLLIIVGPCSAWPKTAVFEYAKRLLTLNQILKNKLKIVMRLYIQKPRTIKGWAGPMNQPDPFGEPDIEAGIYYARSMMVKIVEMGLPIAAECLFTHNIKSFAELISWVAIGARSSEDHEHRIFASAIDCAAGMKNPTHGSLDIGVNSVSAAQYSHMATIDGYVVKTVGNLHAHLVLRGANKSPNYGPKHLQKVYELMSVNNIKNPAVLIDVSHDNCYVNNKKNPFKQPQTIFEILNFLQHFSYLKPLIKGFMIESFLKDGNQPIESNSLKTLDLDGLSITDPCLGWEKTEDLLFELAKMVKI